MSAPAWDGVGDPPVGVTCEWHPSGGQVIVVTILGRSADETWFVRLGSENSEICRDMAFFQPIITEEQIAEQERATAVRAMWAVLESHLPERYRTFDGSDTSALLDGVNEGLRCALGILHDQGYRKTPGHAELVAFAEWVTSKVGLRFSNQPELVSKAMDALAASRGDA